MVGGDTDLVEAGHGLVAINAIEEIGDEKSSWPVMVVGDEEDIFGSG
jgi:hypothetical protein